MASQKVNRECPYYTEFLNVYWRVTYSEMTLIFLLIVCQSLW